MSMTYSKEPHVDLTIAALVESDRNKSVQYKS